MKLPYGSAWQTAQEPDGWIVRAVTVPANRAAGRESEIIRHAIANPVDAPQLRDFVLPSDRIAVLIPDKTRLCRARVILPILLAELEANGVEDDSITLFFASGTHAAQTESEQRAIIGDADFERYRVEENDARNESSFVPVGITSRGTPVLLHRTVATADKVIATGTIVHHYFAGYGGGPKLFVPGSAAYSTAVANHRRTLTSKGDFHPGCRDGAIHGNPVAEDIADSIRFFPPTWYLASLLDMEGRITAAVAGDLVQAHRIGCRHVDAMYRRDVDALSDITLVSAGGSPKDINFIQAHKALHRAAAITKAGGHIIFVAECAEGLGNASFLSWFACETTESFRKQILEHYEMNAHTAAALREKTRRFNITFVSSLDADVVRAMGMMPVPALHDAILEVDGRTSGNPLVYTIDNGSLLLPRFSADGRIEE